MFSFLDMYGEWELGRFHAWIVECLSSVFFRKKLWLRWIIKINNKGNILWCLENRFHNKLMEIILSLLLEQKKIIVMGEDFEIFGNYLLIKNN